MKIHFIGIGGAGLSALANMCLQLGYEVTGSDAVESQNTQMLQDKGVRIFIPNSVEAISSNIDLVIKTSAATKDGPAKAEIEKAEELNIPVKHREYLVNEFAQKQTSIGVAGTHGKTTTTSLVAHALIKLGAQPSYLIGGILTETKTNAEIGTGNYFVWEADEFNNHYHGVTQDYAIINNVEYDHPDIFETLESYKYSFTKFMLENVRKDIVVNADDQILMDLVNQNPELKRRASSFGKANTADYKLLGFSYTDSGQMRVEIEDKNANNYEVTLELKGEHNAYNTLAAFALLCTLGFDPTNAANAITGFSGSGRRFEILFDKNNLRVVSDYAHHPTAIAKTVAAARAAYPNDKLVAVLEPHQYQRVASLLNDYRHIFSEADQVVLLPIYASRDKDTSITSTEELLALVEHQNKNIYSYAEIVAEIKSHLTDDNKTPRTYLCMSAGKLDSEIRNIFKETK